MKMNPNFKFRIKYQCEEGVKYKMIKAHNIAEAQDKFYEKHPLSAKVFIINIWRW